MYSVKELITPAKAREFLSKNIENNRPIMQLRVDAYSADILEGRWITETGDGPKFDTKGRFVDGQHRMLAIIKANKAIEMYVFYDVDPNAVPVIDTGKARTFAHTLRMQEAKEYVRAAAIVKWIYMYRNGCPTNKGNMTPTPSALFETYSKDSDNFVEAARRSDDVRRMRLGNNVASGVAFYLFCRISPSHAHAFFDSLVSGANLNEKSPILVLRNRLMRLDKDRIKPFEVLALYIRAWNNYLVDRPVTTLYYNGVDKKPLGNYNFPEMLLEATKAIQD